MTVHENGVLRHGADWLAANQVVVDALTGSKLKPWDPIVKDVMPLVLLRVLDRLEIERRIYLEPRIKDLSKN